MGTPDRTPVSNAPPESEAADGYSALRGSGIDFLGAPASLRRPARVASPPVAGTDTVVDAPSQANRSLDLSPVSVLHPVEDA
jgi:hypothetical protein